MVELPLRTFHIHCRVKERQSSVVLLLPWQHYKYRRPQLLA